MSFGAVRGVWITNTDSRVFSSRDNIAEAMELLAKSGFNVVFPVVWNKARTLYRSRLMQQLFGVEIDPVFQNRDPLAELIDLAHGAGLKVVPWFEYGFASSYNLNGGLLLSKKPEWAGVDNAGNLLKKNNFEWMNALDWEVQDFLLGLVLEVVKNYNIDGVQGDDRMPAFPCEGGYDAKTVELYRQQFDCYPPSNPKDSQWVQWRADILTEFLSRLRAQVKQINPNLIISMAPSVYKWGLNEYLQDSKTWLDRGLVDAFHPQVYRRDFDSYKLVIDRLVNEQLTPEQLAIVSPGILIKLGSYCINPDDLLRMIEYNRSVGIQGEVLFFYEGLRHNDNALAKALQMISYSHFAASMTRPVSRRFRVSIFERLRSFLTRFFFLLRRWVKRLFPSRE